MRNITLGRFSKYVLNCCPPDKTSNIELTKSSRFSKIGKGDGPRGGNGLSYFKVRYCM